MEAIYLSEQLHKSRKCPQRAQGWLLPEGFFVLTIAGERQFCGVGQETSVPAHFGNVERDK
jgi:hypothetical protein